MASFGTTSRGLIDGRTMAWTRRAVRDSVVSRTTRKPRCADRNGSQAPPGSRYGPRVVLAPRIWDEGEPTCREHRPPRDGSCQLFRQSDCQSQIPGVLRHGQRFLCEFRLSPIRGELSLAAYRSLCGLLERAPLTIRSV
jgi:hypothetical protein